MRIHVFRGAACLCAGSDPRTCVYRYIFGGLFDRSKQRTSKQVIYVSSNGPKGPYTRHPGAPLPMMRPDHFGRNGGRMTRFNDTGLVRFTQYYVKGDSRYGEIVRAALITKLTPYEVEETYNVSWVASLPSEMWPECVVGLSYRSHTQPSADQCVCACVCVRYHTVCGSMCACTGRPRPHRHGGMHKAHIMSTCSPCPMADTWPFSTAASHVATRKLGQSTSRA